MVAFRKMKLSPIFSGIYHAECDSINKIMHTEICAAVYSHFPHVRCSLLSFPAGTLQSTLISHRYAAV
jgi:hypothetical protein